MTKPRIRGGRRLFALDSVIFDAPTFDDGFRRARRVARADVTQSLNAFGAILAPRQRWRFVTVTSVDICDPAIVAPTRLDYVANHYLVTSRNGGDALRLGRPVRITPLTVPLWDWIEENCVG